MSFITRIRVANSTETVAAEVYPCRFEDFVAWQRRIQPFIAATKGIGSQWDWPAIFLGCHVSEQLAGRHAIAFQIRVADVQGDAVPVAQAMFSVPYPWPGDVSKDGVFVWFVASATAAALRAHGIHQRFATLAPVLDVAVQLSLAHTSQRVASDCTPPREPANRKPTRWSAATSHTACSSGEPARGASSDSLTDGRMAACSTSPQRTPRPSPQGRMTCVDAVTALKAFGEVSMNTAAKSRPLEHAELVRFDDALSAEPAQRSIELAFLQRLAHAARDASSGLLERADLATEASVDSALAHMQGPAFQRAARAMEQTVASPAGFGRFRGKP